MKKSITLILPFLLSAYLLCGFTYAQQQKFHENNKQNDRKEKAARIFNEVKNGIAHRNVGMISNHLSSQTYLNLMDGANGYYSSNQAFYVLEEFFKEYQIITFKFQNIEVNENNPFATGEYFYEHRGKRGIATVYIALKYVRRNWRITQITIN